MKLRRLEQKDAPFMLEWMHDLFVVKYLQSDFMHKTIEDCYSFIEAAQDITKNMHLAITDENDEYMGTVSLKNINADSAEFAITIRKIAMGKGYSKYGMEEIIGIGFEELCLNKIYWCVSPENLRACKFYDKNRYRQMRLTKDEESRLMTTGYSLEQINHYKWYQIKKNNISQCSFSEHKKIMP